VTVTRAEIDLDTLAFARGGGLVTVVAQDAESGAVLMVAHANREALELTLATGEMHYTSRRRGLWHKGATSGNTQHVVSLTADCDRDSVLARVRVAGPACHVGEHSCFGDAALDATPVAALDRVIAQRVRERHAESYTQRLLQDRNLRLKKLGEEAAELVMACCAGDPPCASAEAADLVYHTLVALHAAGATWSMVAQVLAGRAGARETTHQGEKPPKG
jgi:phosphoribosyl-ATP pyrophosphohydrolase/phosphoribosyl-AMP cyclohydrolase